MDDAGGELYKQLGRAVEGAKAPAVITVLAGLAEGVAEDGKPVLLRATLLNVTNKAYWGQPLLSSLALALSASVDF